MLRRVLHARIEPAEQAPRKSRLPLAGYYKGSDRDGAIALRVRSDG
jgi:hypothetical protein